MPGEVWDINSGRTGGTPQSGGPRRLAAIVAGDIAGYSRLMQIDEEGTHSRVRRIERELIEPTIREHHGRLMKTTGDGFIAIFESPVEAVRCGIVIQQNMIGRNAALAPMHRIEYRIGINLGDVIVDSDDVFGDGVNIAARLESIAAPGEVYISGGIYEQIKHKIVCGYESLGDRKVKNITDPIRVYRVLSDPAAFNRSRRSRNDVLIVAFGLLLLAGASAAIWYQLPLIRGSAGPAAPEKTAARGVPAQAKAAAAIGKSAPPATVPPERQAAVAPGAATPSPAQPEPSAPLEPEMIPVPAGTFLMGSNEDPSEKPVHQVAVKRFAIGKYPVSVREWNACAAAKACPFTASGNDAAPVTNVSWSDARRFTAWLADTTRKRYRLPTEAEWEYAARGGTATRYWWGDQFQAGIASCKNCAQIAAALPDKVGSFKANPFGLYDMGGTVDQWVEDCWHRNYHGAPSDGSPWDESDCTAHVLRSGSWRNDSQYVRPANRDSYDTNVRYPTHGLRVALDLQ